MKTRVFLKYFVRDCGLLNIRDAFFGILSKPWFEESSLIPVFNGVINLCFDFRLIKQEFNPCLAIETRV